MDKLVVCKMCQRHVKERDARCPFCRNAMPSAHATIALVGAMAVGVGLSLAACGGQSIPTDGGVDSGADADGGMIVAYSPPPPVDSGADADGGLLVAYGPPPPQDAGGN